MLAALPPNAHLALLPPQVVLTAHGSAVRELAGQRLIVERVAGGRFAGDVTAKALFRSSNPRVAVVTRDGTVLPVAAGRATVTAAIGDTKASAGVTVRTPNTEHRTPNTAPSFRNQIEPVLTKMGCNSGACHGASAGQGGMKLTLRGFDAETDHA